MNRITEVKIRFIYLLFLIFVLIFVVASSMRYYDKLGFYEEKFEVLQSGWQRVLPDGSKKRLYSTGESVPEKELLIERQLPQDVPYALTSLFIRTVHQDITVWIDGRVVYEFKYADIPPFNSKIPPISWVRIPVQKDQLGKMIRIELTGRGRTAENTLGGIYFGEDVSIICAILWKNALQILAAFCLMFLGIGMWVEYILVDKKKGDERGAYYTGVSLFFMGLWLGCQIDARQLIFNNILLLWNLEYLSIIMIPVPALLFINKVEKGLCQRELFLLSFFIFICDTLIIFSAGVGIFSFAELNLPIDILGLITAIEVLRSFYMVWKKDKHLFRELTWMMGAYCTLIGFCMIELLSYMISGYTNQGKFLSIGTIIFAFQIMHAQGIEYDKVQNEKSKLEISDKVQAEFLANMSHEIRTPINTVIGMNEMILRESRDDAVLSYAQDIQASGQTLLSLVNDILDFSRIESGGIKLVPKPYELATVIHEINSMVRFRAEWKGLQFEILVDGDTPAVLYGDAFRVREVILNLIDNAIKYTEKGKITLSVTARALDEEGNSPVQSKEETGLSTAKAIELQIAVKDTGVGVKESDQKLIFQKFQRVQSGWSQNIQGTGLGLPITNYFVEIMNGHIQLDSVFGEGSCFTAYIPQWQLNEDRIGNYEERYQKQRGEKKDFNKGFIAKDARILVVDDNELNLRLVQNLLKRTEVQITCAFSGEECIEKLREENFDIIFLDHMMPGMDGEETLKKIRENAFENRYGKPVPVIAFSSNMLPGIRQKYVNTSFDAYLTKPVDGNELEKTLYTFLPENLIRKRTNEEYFQTELKKHAIVEKEEEEKTLDRSTGLQYCMQDEEVYREILGLFRDSSDEKMQELEKAFAEKDYSNYRLYAHGLKTTSLTVGAVKLSENAKKLEHAAKRVVDNVEKEEAEHYIAYNHEAFMALYRKTIQEAREYLQ